MPDHDRNLLFGLLALQNNIIGEDDLLKAFRAWTRDKSRSIEQILRDQGAVTETQCERLEGLLLEHLERHGSAEKSLAALTPVAPAIASLRQVADSDLNVSLGHIGKARLDPFATRPPTPNELSAAPAARFRHLRPHAKGGLGEVSVALDNELNREVALKQIQDHHADRPDSRMRFLVEAEITGGLEHPGIVPVYSLGHDPTGRPYYAMRFIEGETLSKSIARFHAESAKAAPGDRVLAFRKLLRRFLDVCNAVAYAHSRSVLHRDLKPDNIMVGDFGETLVVDWGLAKAAGQSEPPALDGSRPLIPASGSGSSETMQGQAIGTPAFMSPEQAVGEIDGLGPTTDIYSLGATLYDLLTGKPPFAITDDERGSNDLGPILSRVSRGDFPPPRAVDPSVPKPLEAICLKAMALSPADRYPTPRALATDLEHWLADEPVSAHPETLTARMARWTRRHKSATLSAAAALLVISVVSTLSYVLVHKALTAEQTALGKQKEATEAADRDRKRAEAREAMAVDAIEKFQKAVIDNPQLGDPRFKPLRDTLLKEPLQFSRNLRQLLQADGDTRPESLARLAAVCFSLGNTTVEIGDQEDALTAFEESLTIRERLARENPAVTDYQNRLADSHNNIGILQSGTGQNDLALKSHGRAMEIYERLARENPAVTDYQNRLAASHNNIGNLQSGTGQNDLALKSYGRALEIQERLARENPAVTDYQNHLADSHNNIGILQSGTGQNDLALKSFGRALEIRERLARENPSISEYRINLAGCHYNIACAQALNSAATTDANMAKSRAEDAMNALRRADVAGYADWKHAAEDTDLKALRDRPDFQELLKAKLTPKAGGAK